LSGAPYREEAGEVAARPLPDLRPVEATGQAVVPSIQGVRPSFDGIQFAPIPVSGVSGVTCSSSERRRSSITLLYGSIAARLEGPRVPECAVARVAAPPIVSGVAVRHGTAS
jgi:hypothetical protein